MHTDTGKRKRNVKNDESSKKRVPVGRTTRSMSREAEQIEDLDEGSSAIGKVGGFLIMFASTYLIFFSHL